MALKNVREAAKSSSFKKVTEMAVGETIKGYLVAAPANRFNEEAKDIILRDKETGATVRYATAGTLKRDLGDGYYTIGAYTEITRNNDTKEKSKEGKAYTLTNFNFAQDLDDVFTDLDAALGSETVSSKPSPKKNFDIAAVRAQAAALKSQATK